MRAQADYRDVAIECAELERHLAEREINALDADREVYRELLIAALDELSRMKVLVRRQDARLRALMFGERSHSRAEGA